MCVGREFVQIFNMPFCILILVHDLVTEVEA